MIDITTRYLGLDLAHPVMPGASPLTDDLDMVRRLEDAGAACVVMRSLFEEQILHEFDAVAGMEAHAHGFAEAATFVPTPSEFALGPDRYLIQILRIKEAVDIPVIASLNGITPERWLEYGRLIQEAGADALELNVYHLATSPMESGGEVERRVFEALSSVRQAVRIPVAVKLSPFYSALANLACRLDAEGADGLVLFNRFFQPDIDVEKAALVERPHLSRPEEHMLPLRWIGLLSGRVKADLVASTGLHNVPAIAKMLLAGASAVQVTSALYLHKMAHIRTLNDGLAEWMTAHGYTDLASFRGKLSQQKLPDPTSYERAQYIKLLIGFD